MFKKILGSVITDTPKAPAYDVPEELPALDPSVNNVLPRIKLPDSIKQYMNDPAYPVDEPASAVVPDAGAFTKDALSDAAADTVAQKNGSKAGEAFASSFKESDGNSATFLSSLLKDPRFALISVKFLAFGLKKETAIMWAAESASLGYAIAGKNNGDKAVKMSATEQVALEQAKIYANGGKVSSDEMTGLVAEMGMDKPGAPTALATAWAQDPPPPEAGDSRDLVGEMVAAAVLLSVTMTLPEKEQVDIPDAPEAPAAQLDMPKDGASIIPENTKESVEVAAALKPFMDRGLELAATS